MLQKPWESFSASEITMHNLNTFLSLRLQILSEETILQQSFDPKCTGDSLNLSVHFAIANAFV